MFIFWGVFSSHVCIDFFKMYTLKNNEIMKLDHIVPNILFIFHSGVN